MKEAYKTLVKVYSYKGNEFVIIKGIHDGIIRAINYKFIDENGYLIRPLNGLEMYVNTIDNTIEGVTRQINSHIDWQEFIKENDIDTNDSDELLKAVIKFHNLHYNEK